MASWTTTMVIVSTSVATDTIDTAIVVRMPRAASGPPVVHSGITSKPSRRSNARVTADSTDPATTQTTGMNHKLDRTRHRREEPFTTPGHYP